MSQPELTLTSAKELGISNSQSIHKSQTHMDATEVPNGTFGISCKILDIVEAYALNKFSSTKERLAAGRPKFLSVIDKFVAAGDPVMMCLPAFPFKSANKVYKVFGYLPDKAEELSLDRLNTMCRRIKELYAPGAKLTIISDGLVYNDLLGILDRDTWNYGEALRRMAERKGFDNIDFSRLKDLANFPGLPEKLQEISYVANATNFRRVILNKYGKEDIDIDYEIATNPDTKLTYLGYRRFLESDLQYIFPLGEGRTSNGYKRDVKYLAKQMLIRGYAFAGACKTAFPHHLRLSIHQSMGEHKVSMSLLNTKTGFTTPWHCSVALMTDGEWVSAPMGEFKKDPKFEVVYEDGRPSYFRETLGSTATSAENPVTKQVKSVPSEREKTHNSPRFNIPSESSKYQHPNSRQFLSLVKQVSLYVEQGSQSLGGDATLFTVGIFVYSIIVFLIGGMSYRGSLEAGVLVGGALLLVLAILLAPFVTVLEARMIRKVSH